MKQYIAIISLVFAACGARDSEDSADYASEYPPEFRGDFLVNCQGETTAKGASKAQSQMYCACMLEKLINNYSYQELNDQPSTTIEKWTEKYGQGCFNKSRQY